MAVDAQIRKTSKGERTVDNIVLNPLDRKRARKDFGVDQWGEFILAELGGAALIEYAAIENGTLL